MKVRTLSIAMLAILISDGGTFAAPKHTKVSSLKFGQVLYCDSEVWGSKKANICLDSKVDNGLPVSFFPSLNDDSKNENFRVCTATTGASTKVDDAVSTYEGSVLKSPTCKPQNKVMIAVVGEKDARIENLDFSKIDKIEKKKEIAKLLTKQSWYSELIRTNSAFSDAKKLKIQTLSYKKIDYYVITIEKESLSNLIFGTKDSLEVVNGMNSGGDLAAAILVNKKPIVIFHTCIFNTDATAQFEFELVP